MAGEPVDYSRPDATRCESNKIKLYFNKTKVIVNFVEHNLKHRFSARTLPLRMPQPTHWFERLSEEDRSFIKRFVLASGSLKAVAGEYGISYPTVRLRLDRLIEKIRVFDDAQITSEFERTLRGLYAEGKLEIETMKQLLARHRDEITAVQELQTRQEPQP